LAIANPLLRNMLSMALPTALSLPPRAGGLNDEPRSHVGIVGTATALRGHPGDVGVWILNIAGFAVNAVLSVYDVLQIGALADPLVDSSWTIARRRACMDVVFRRSLNIDIVDM
jgi:hypothetical protein